MEIWYTKEDQQIFNPHDGPEDTVKWMWTGNLFVFLEMSP